jgi:nucleotide-binding universal stress UspA family protein
VAVHDQAAVGILEAAKSQGADLIALATHGRKGTARMLLGSVADKVLRAAPVPTLIYRPVEAEPRRKSNTKIRGFAEEHVP